jgi:hypothetical protein
VALEPSPVPRFQIKDGRSHELPVAIIPCVPANRLRILLCRLLNCRNRFQPEEDTATSALLLWRHEMRAKLLTKNSANRIQKSAESECHKRGEEDITRPAGRPTPLMKHGDRATPYCVTARAPVRLLKKPD